MRYAQIVMGPAGAGKSTYCSTMQNHGQVSSRNIQIVNLDPAAEQFSYTPIVDVKDLVQLDDVMEADDLNYGPNGGLIFCMEYLVEADGISWLKEQLGDMDEDYVIFDCPGQIELYTHMNLMRRFVDTLQSWNFRVCAVFMMDAHYMVDGAKFLAGSLAALSAMVSLEVPHINVLSKMDLLNKAGAAQLEMFLDPDAEMLLTSDHTVSKFNKKYHKLSKALGSVLTQYSLVRFVPLNMQINESISDLLLQIDNCLQYGEDLDVKTTDYDYPDLDEDSD